MVVTTRTMAHPKPYVAADIVLFGFDPKDDCLQVLLIQRSKEPYRGQLALPGGYVHQGESAEQAALRILHEKTALQPNHIEQLYTFSDPKRDTSAWVVSVAHLGVVRSDKLLPRAGLRTTEAFWSPIEAVIAPLAFDHTEILRMGITRLEGKVQYTPLAFELLPTEFTLAEARHLYEVLLRRKLDPSNFNKRMQSLGLLKQASVRRGVHRPAPVYTFDSSAYAALGQVVEFVTKGTI